MSEQTPYIVSARKYRPATFRSVVGQKALTATLKNAIDSHRLAQAYLFCGPRGVGKTSCARIFAKTINCEHPTPDGEACGVCDSCRAIEQGNSFNLVELDAASNNSVDDIRAITEQVGVPPQRGQYRVFIIDEVHMLSNAAFNAFLKTLEEPPKYVVFILATTEKHKVIPTILSRCQIYDFKRITVDDMIDHLEYVAKEEGIETDRDALGVIALKADGAMRDALSIFDQVSASSRGKVTYANTIESLNVLDYDYYFRFVDAFREGKVAQSLLIYKEIRDKGFDSLFLVNGLAAHVRDLMVAADPRTHSLLETSEEISRRYIEQAKTLPVQWYYSAMRLLSDCDAAYRTATGKRLLVELTLIRLCQLIKPAASPFEEPGHRAPLGDVRNPGKAVVSSPVGQSSQPAVQSSAPAVSSVPPTAPAVIPVSAKPAAPAPPRSYSSPRTAAARDGAPYRPQTFRLSGHLAEEGSPKVSSLELRKNSYTDEQFMDAWGEFIARNPQLHILVNAMRAARPQRGSDNTFRIVVEHPAQRQAFESAMPKLLEFLRERLGNDLLALHVEVDESVQVARQLPPREFLKQIVEENPDMGEFLRELNCEIV